MAFEGAQVGGMSGPAAGSAEKSDKNAFAPNPV
jgi:hypothetical protein